jgi:histidine phosphotransferase ChpT
MPTVPGLDPLTLAASLCARLCHDLAGSLGALTGTLEIAAEENDREALDLALTISRELAARLRLLRAAWGSDADIPPPASLLPGLPGAEKLTLDTAALTAETPETLRLSLSLLLVAAAGLPRGGLIRLSGPDTRQNLDIEGPRAAWPEALSACLSSDAALIAAARSPRSLAIALACLQARALGRKITLASPTSLTITP